MPDIEAYGHARYVSSSMETLSECTQRHNGPTCELGKAEGSSTRPGEFESRRAFLHARRRFTHQPDGFECSRWSRT